MRKSIKFVPPIELPNGAMLFTLEDAGRYIMALPAKQRNRPEWDFAGRRIVEAVKGESIEMMARIAFMRALGGLAPGSLPVQPPRDSSKDHIHEFRNRKRRDPWR